MTIARFVIRVDVPMAFFLLAEDVGLRADRKKGRAVDGKFIRCNLTVKV